MDGLCLIALSTSRKHKHHMNHCCHCSLLDKTSANPRCKSTHVFTCPRPMYENRDTSIHARRSFKPTRVICWECFRDSPPRTSKPVSTRNQNEPGWNRKISLLAGNPLVHQPEIVNLGLTIYQKQPVP